MLTPRAAKPELDISTIDPDDTVFDQLRQLDSCTLSDAVDSLSLPPAISGLRRQSGSGTTVGRAITVQLAAGKPPENRPKTHLCANAIEHASSDSIICISHPGIDAGGWGGILTVAATIKEVAGVVINGFTRDLDEARALNFPIYAKSTTARTARGRLYEESTNKIIKLEGCDVTPGDYIVADDSGIVVIQQDQIFAVLSKAQELRERERMLIKRLESGQSVVKVLDAKYEDMLQS